MNDQAAAVATSVVNETIEAATRCEQVTQDQQLVPGKFLDQWDRETFTAKLSAQPGVNVMSGAPEDRQIVILYLPLDGGKSKYMQAAARMQEAAGAPRTASSGDGR